MSKEQDLLNAVRHKVGDDEFRFLLKANALSVKISEDISEHWDEWVEAARSQVNSQGKMFSPYVALAAALIGQAAESMIDLSETTETQATKEQFAGLCGDIFSLCQEARNKASVQ